MADRLIQVLQNQKDILDAIRVVLKPIFNGEINASLIDTFTQKCMILEQYGVQNVSSLIRNLRPTETAIIGGYPCRLDEIGRIESSTFRLWALQVLYTSGKISLSQLQTEAKKYNLESVPIGFLERQADVSQYIQFLDIINELEQRIQVEIDYIKDAGITDVKFNALIIRDIINSNVTIDDVIQSLES